MFGHFKRNSSDVVKLCSSSKAQPTVEIWKKWKYISNKSFLKNTIAQNKDFELNTSAKMNPKKIMRSDSGIHCISTGMRYFGYDVLKDNSAKSNKLMIGLREKEVNKWNIICKDKPKLLQFLKDNIHKDAWI